MADDSEDLVSKVSIEGLDESTKGLEEFGDKGAEAFGKVAAAAAAAGVTVGKGTAAIEKSTKSAGDATDGLNKSFANLSGRPTSAQLDLIGDSIDQLAKKGVKAAKDLTQFVTRVAGMATAGAAAIVGIGKLGATIASQVNQSTSAFDQNNAAQQRVVNTNLSASQAAIQYADQQSKLNRQFADGTIDYDTYFKTLDQNKQAYNDQIKVTEKLSAVQEGAREDIERLQKQAADHKAFSDLSATFGGPLLSSLITLGNTAIQVKNQFIQAFGPGASAFVDTLTSALNSNAGSISSFFDSAGQKISAFVSQNGPAIQQALSSIGSAAATIFDGLIAAMPTLLSFFNDQFVPAVRTVASFVDQLVQGFNSIFGTKFTTGAAVILVALTSLSGGFKLIIGLSGLILPAMNLLIGLFSSLLGPVGLLVIAFVALYYAIDWQKFGDNAVAAGNAIISFFSSIPGAVTGFFQSIFDYVGSGWTSLTKTISDLWNGVVSFFQGLPDQITSIFQGIWDKIVSAFKSAVDSISTTLQSWVASAMSYLTPLLNILKAIAALGGAGATSGDGDSSNSTQAFASGGAVRGPGTSTSDSILARLSNKEWVMQAKAVRKYGSSFMRAINEGRLDLRGMVQGFAAGGSPFGNLAPAPIRFANSAPLRTPSGGVLNLTIGQEEFNGLVMPDEDTATKLTRYAINKHSRSAGRRPTWTGGGR